MNLLFNSPRKIFTGLIIVSTGMMAVAMFMEHVLKLEPCMLCYLQRFFVVLLGLIGFIGFFHNPQKIIVFKIYLVVAISSTVLGAVFSIRQLFLQSLPEELVPSCAPDIEYLLSSLPFMEVVLMAIQGDGNCAEVLWSFLGISIPGWLLLTFFIIAIWLLRIFWLANEIHSQKLLR